MTVSVVGGELDEGSIVNVLNLLPFTVAYLPGRLGFPRHSLTLIVKGTFDLSLSGAASPAEEQAFPTGDGYYAGDDEGTGSPRYESDFACFKPRSDLLLVGKCHPPGGQPARRCTVTFSVAGRARTLTAVGNRRRHVTEARWSDSEPELFTEMELRWENSFGGAGYGKNPVGKGYCPPGRDPGSEGLPLPNIEVPSDEAASTDAGLKPVGFGPLGRTWADRTSRLGTYTAGYRETRWPWFPEDFDWGHFNAAPRDMQAEPFLRGDEELYCENLHPVHAQYSSRLPGVRVRCFLDRRAGDGTNETVFGEVPMNLDTLWLDMEAGKLVLLWRGTTEVLSEEADEVRDLFIMSEALQQEPAPIEQCRRRFLEARAAQEEPAELSAEEPPDAEERPDENPAPEPEVDAAALAGQTNAILARMGIDVERLPPAVRDKQARLLKTIAKSDPDALVEAESQALHTELRAALDSMGLDPDHLPPVSEKAEAELTRLMNEFGVKEAAPGAVPELQQLGTIMAAALPKAGINPEDLSPVIAQARKLRALLGDRPGIEEDGRAEKREQPPPLTREAVLARAAAGESLAGANLKGLDLSGLELRDLDFSGAVMAGAVLKGADLRAAILAEADLTTADLSGADLTGANLASADLSGANLQGACLQDADLTQGNLTEARLGSAVLTAAVCEGTKLPRAVLEGVKAARADFSGADASGAVFKNAELQEADFSGGQLHDADFEGANLAGACVEGARGSGVDFSRADLSGLRASEGCDFSDGKFYRVVGAGSTWENAKLARSDFRYSRLEGATFTGACLEAADLSAANVKFGRFDKANLRAARLVQANLFEGNLERADLTGADFSGSNLYGAELLDAVIERTKMDGANLKMTKLDAKA